MKGNMCRLYDEQLVRNIMISTAMSVFEHIGAGGNLRQDDICDYIEENADRIIESTIDGLSDIDDGDGVDDFDSGPTS